MLACILHKNLVISNKETIYFAHVFSVKAGSSAGPGAEAPPSRRLIQMVGKLVLVVSQELSQAGAPGASPGGPPRGLPSSLMARFQDRVSQENKAKYTTFKNSSLRSPSITSAVLLFEAGVKVYSASRRGEYQGQVSEEPVEWEMLKPSLGDTICHRNHLSNPFA